MYKNRALIDRVLNTPSDNDNSVMMYRKLTSLIEQYNRLAIIKGLPLKKVPNYTGNINEVLITRAINAILNDIDKLQSIKDRDDGPPPLRYGVYDGEFPSINSTFVIGSWKYSVEDLDGNIGLKVSINDTSITKMPEDLPFNVITDNQDAVLNVTGMTGMFGGCSALTSIDLSNFNTSSIMVMGGMFSGCKVLTDITFGNNFDTSSVIDMSYMFSDCESLTSIDLNNFDTSRVMSMLGMFSNCTNLTSLTFGNQFNTSNDTDIENMFYSCTNLTSIQLYKVSDDLLSAFPGGISEWSINGTPLTNTAWDNSWGDGPVTFTRTI